MDRESRCRFSKLTGSRIIAALELLDLFQIVLFPRTGSDTAALFTVGCINTPLVTVLPGFILQTHDSKLPARHQLGVQFQVILSSVVTGLISISGGGLNEYSLCPWQAA